MKTFTTTSTAPRVYVGTYAKYSSGSIAGAWLGLDDYDDKEAFLEACTELHADESDPELMFQDFEGIPEGMISESHIGDDLWDWINLDDDDDKTLLAVYRDNIDTTGTLVHAREAFEGIHASAAGWAESFIDECGMLESMPENLRGYFDYESYARDCGYDGMSFIEVSYHEVYVFRSV